MSIPKVSIVVPVYNTEKYLEQCIASLLAQTLSEIEIIIVDDGSKSECAQLCDTLAKTDSRISVIHKQNGGLGLARNTGISASLGEYVGFVDSDDYVKPTMFESLYSAASRYGADLAISGMSFVGGNTFAQSGDYEEKHYFSEDTIFENEGVRELLLGVVGALPKNADDSRYGVSVCKNIFRRELLLRGNIEFFSERKIISEDTLFMVDFVKRTKKAVGIHGAFYCYRRNDASLSKSYRSDRFEKVLIFLSELEKHISDTFATEEYALYFDRLVQGYGRILCSQEILYAHDNKIKYRALKARLAEICTHEAIKGALKDYPWYQLPKKQAAFAFCMKHRLYLLQKVMVLLRAR